MPARDFLYLGDTARVPYGRKPPEMVRGFAMEIAAFLAERGAEGIVVACGNQALRLIDLQLEGKKAMPIADFLRGVPVDQFNFIV